MVTFLTGAKKLYETVFCFFDYQTELRGKKSEKKPPKKVAVLTRFFEWTYMNNSNGLKFGADEFEIS